MSQKFNRKKNHTFLLKYIREINKKKKERKKQKININN